MSVDNGIAERFAEALAACPFVCGVVLGGSMATGVADARSDMDIGVYYDHSALDLPWLNRVVSGLDDAHRATPVCAEGGWGAWVNCGAWLSVDGFPVDLILRDINRVTACVGETDRGVVACHYQPGHPHAYLNAMYRGELGSAKVLYARDAAFSALRERARVYPDALADALISFFTFEAGFSRDMAAKAAPAGDAYYVAGHLFRAVSALNQALFAANRVYCLNEKKAVRRIDGFALAPADYAARVNAIFTLSPDRLPAACEALSGLCDSVFRVCSARGR